MAIYIGVALGLLVCGLVVCALAGNLKYELAVRVAWWVGLVLAVCGALLIVTPILAWITAQLRAMLGV